MLPEGWRRRAATQEFLRFGVVGTLGFCWDTATVYTLRHLAGIYAAGAAGFIVAATANWALNRAWTFRHHAHDAPHRQWLRFLAANAAGFVLNRGTFFILVAVSAICRANPVFAIAAGSAAGLALNFVFSKKFVFRNVST